MIGSGAGAVTSRQTGFWVKGVALIEVSASAWFVIRRCAVPLFCRESLKYLAVVADAVHLKPTLQVGWRCVHMARAFK